MLIWTTRLVCAGNCYCQDNDIIFNIISFHGFIKYRDFFSKSFVFRNVNTGSAISENS